MKFEARRIRREDVDTLAWNRFAEASEQGSAYVRAEHLDAVAPGWEALVVAHDTGAWLAAMPAYFTRKYGLDLFRMAPFSQHWGPMLQPPALKPYERWEQSYDLVEALLGLLPRQLAITDFACSPHLNALAPFHWAGYRLLTRLNMILPPGSYHAHSSRTKLARLLQKGHDEGFVHRREPTPELILERSRTSGIYRSPKTVEALTRLLKTAEGREWAKWHTVFAPDGTPAVAGILFRFRNRFVNLVALSRTEFRQSPAMTLYMHYGILWAHEEGCTFDFEGSMLKGVEHFNRGFLPLTERYTRVYRTRFPRVFLP